MIGRPLSLQLGLDFLPAQSEGSPRDHVTLQRGMAPVTQGINKKLLIKRLLIACSQNLEDVTLMGGSDRTQSMNFLGKITLPQHTHTILTS